MPRGDKNVFDGEKSLHSIISTWQNVYADE